MDRNEAIELIDAKLHDLNLDDSYGIIDCSGKSNTGRSYLGRTFCRARITDGAVHVFGPSFIVIKWQTGIRDLPRTGSQVVRNVVDALKFLETFK